MATTNGKDTIYIDIDDEITSVIEKVRASDEKIVALVLPKRASVLQSIVNMKLLKRSAENAKKNVVLITSEAGLLPLAAAVGFHVAKNLQTKPEIPTAAGVEPDDAIEDESMEGPEEEPEVTAATAGNKPVGELAAASGAGAAAGEGIETLSMDDDDAADAPSGTDGAKKPPKKNKKLAVPNFDKFRVRLALAGLAVVLLVILLYVCNSVLPKATITLTTDTSDVNSSLTLTLDSSAKVLDADKLVLPATVQKLDKSGSQQVPTTGKKNTGNKASGTVTITNCSGDDTTLPAGLGFSASGLTFISQTSVTVPDSNYTSPISGSKCKNDGKATVDVMAQSGGANYNLGSTGYTIATSPSGLSAQGSQMSGGTDNVIQVVAQADVDSATQKITAQNNTSVKAQLQDQLKQAGLFPITNTFVAGDPATTTSSQVGDQASTLTVTQITPYTMFGIKQSDLKTVIDNDVKKHIDPSKQSILDEGISKATFHVNNSNTTAAQIGFSTTATAGPDLSVDTIKKQAAGKKSGDVESALKDDPGVQDVNIKLSPFWVNHIPGKTSKLTVIFQKASK